MCWRTALRSAVRATRVRSVAPLRARSSSSGRGLGVRSWWGDILRVPIVLDDRPLDDLIHQEVGVGQFVLIEGLRKAPSSFLGAGLHADDHLRRAHVRISQGADAGFYTLAQLRHRQGAASDDVMKR